MHELVQDYYGRQIQHSADLKTSACCDISQMPEWMRPLLARIHPEILSSYYGCGLICPPLLNGCRVLDLGCGTGRDVYALAQMVGPTGQVIGVDMTEQQLAIAERHKAYHRKTIGYDNTVFINGLIEHLDELALEPESFDVIVSNCVVNLSPDKDAVLRGIMKLLKPGGEFYFSDVYADRRVPDNVRNDAILYGECLGGALYWNDFISTAQRQGFADPRLVDDRPLQISDPELAARVGEINFYSATYRLFKLAELETACEDYAQSVIYSGSILHHPHRFQLDKHHTIETGREFRVCGNTWRMLHESRFRPHFSFTGNFTRHFGLFEGCGSGLPFDPVKGNNPSSNCC